MNTPPTQHPIDLPLLARILDVEEDDPRAMTRAARLCRATLPQLVLSASQTAGARLGTGSADELRRAEERADTYTALLTRVTSAQPVRVLKGQTLARHYPPGLRRPVGDLDLVVPDEPALWRVVRTICDNAPVEHIDISLFGCTPRHLLATLTWPPADPLLDWDLKVEVSTAAFVGEAGLVPVRATAPDDQDLTNLLALAEERFQRPFHLVDVLDALSLAPTWSGHIEDTATLVDTYRLAPETAELLDLATRHAPLDQLASLRRALDPLIAREQARRSSWAPDAPSPHDPVRAHLAQGLPWYGMLLRRPPHPRSWPHARIIPGPEHQFLLTPHADYLLVDSELVDPSRYHAALHALEHLADLDGERL